MHIAMDGWMDCFPVSESSSVSPNRATLLCQIFAMGSRVDWDAMTAGTDMQNLNGCKPCKKWCVGDRRCWSGTFHLHRHFISCTDCQKFPVSSVCAERPAATQGVHPPTSPSQRCPTLKPTAQQQLAGAHAAWPHQALWQLGSELLRGFSGLSHPVPAAAEFPRAAHRAPVLADSGAVCCAGGHAQPLPC